MARWRHLRNNLGKNSIFNEFGVVFDQDEAATLRDTFLGFGIPWLVLLLIAIYPFITHKVTRFRQLPIWLALQEEDKISTGVKYMLVALATGLSAIIAVVW